VINFFNRANGAINFLIPRKSQF